VPALPSDIVLRLYPDLYDPDGADPDALAQLNAAAITVNPLTEGMILIRVIADASGEAAVEIDAAPVDSPAELATLLAQFAAVLSTGEAVGVSIPHFPPTDDPQENP
jgi:hypothetical protein